MYTSIKGYYENGKVILEETPPVTEKTPVVITFLESEPKRKIKTGWLEGKIYIAPDFDEPLDDLKEYM